MEKSTEKKIHFANTLLSFASVPIQRTEKLKNIPVLREQGYMLVKRSEMSAEW